MLARTLLLLGAALLSAAPATAETLATAIEAAYATNPELGAQRAAVRQADELVPQALVAGRPTVGSQLSAEQAALSFADNGRTYIAGLQINQSLYRGGRVGTATSAAENRILAARSRLRAVENQIILNVVTAYADVIRFARVVELNNSQVNVLEREQQQSKDRFEVGDLTRTDVAQSQARRANAVANLVVAENQFAAARQAFLRVVGRLPDNLEPMPPLPLLPGTSGQAVDFARDNNANVLAARFDEAAARYDVKTLQKQRLPTVDAQLGAAYVYQEAGGGGNSFVRQGGFFTQTGGLTATVPLYQAGLVGSQVREAQARQSQLLETISVTGRQVEENVTNSFNQLRAARAVIEANQVAVDANTLAAEGVQQENQVGTRTIIEVLNAEQERLNAEVNLVTARREEQVAAYSLLASVGAAEAVALGVPVQEFDAVSNARYVRHRIVDDTGAGPPALPLPEDARASRSALVGPPQP
ncbi:membrane protein [Polymorphobacter glacialis]|uniref:Membrane protein n=1 Tax=Sandarakinorhabdus glacialis TaxID=1614636 RepID=A0A917E983_9SPHN|nr:TolC family outer membrane protein [Polymorphobacter glacialis]GGE13183.1 membrane protein [Polymorphobacter glacialis]